MPTKKSNIPEKKKQVKTAKKPTKQKTKKAGAHGNKKDPKTGLTLQQEKFVRMYCGIDLGHPYDTLFERLEPIMISLLGNATLSYMNAYQGVKYNSARANASDLLANPNIRNRIKDTIEIAGWSLENAQLQHLHVMMQDRELPAKMRAVELFYRLTGAVIDKSEHTIKVNPEDMEAIDALLTSRSAALHDLDD